MLQQLHGHLEGSLRQGGGEGVKMGLLEVLEVHPTRDLESTEKN